MMDDVATPQELNAQLPGEEAELSPEEKQAQLKARLCAAIAQMIRERGQQEQYLMLTELCEQTELDSDTIQPLLDEMRAQEEYKDICVYEGAKDRYFYTYPLLAHNYVKNVAMAQENDLPHIIAETVRYESRIYPRATNITAFGKYPYRFTAIQVKRMLSRMCQQAEYADLETYESANKNFYIFSTKHLSRKYAEYLIEYSEDIHNFL